MRQQCGRDTAEDTATHSETGDEPSRPCHLILDAFDPFLQLGDGCVTMCGLSVYLRS
jgi:hypothetical protein